MMLPPPAAADLVDTDVLCRYLLNDHPASSSRRAAARG
jgi:hypothetical protein